MPVTFGQPFKTGDWKHKETGLVARDNFNQPVPLQYDDISSYRDGSSRFAVLNAQLSGLQAGERRIINLFTGSASAPPQLLPSNPAWNLSLEAKIYNQQVNVVTFGDRNGHTDGTPFLVGEKIVMTITGPTTESFQQTITSDMAGGGYITLTKIAEAFQQLVNSQSQTYIGEKIGGGYEKLWLKTKNPAQGAFQVSFSYSGQAKIAQVNQSNYEAPQTWVIDGQDLLKQQISMANASQASANRRFHGPVASEFKLAIPFKNVSTGKTHDFLTARLDTRMFEGGQKIRTNVIIENNWTFKANPKNVTYEMAFKVNGATVHQQPIFTHYHHARWQKMLWTGVEPKVQLRHNMRYFLDSRAVWNYDLSIRVSEATLAAEATNLARARTQQATLGPMGNAFLEPSFGSTGGRPEIGPLPRWTALYLISQDERARASMMAVADAAAAVPIHFRDENTDSPINTVANPNVSTHFNSNNLPDSTDPTIWGPDTAHQASYVYVPYLLTGDNFYLDEAMFWASWNVFSMPASYREFGKSLINRQQVRGSAWALRSIGEAYRIVPDNHSMKSYFKTVLDNNLAWYKQNYVVNHLGSPMGAIQHEVGQTPPWQNDFVGTVMALLAENNEPNAKDVHDWFSQFNVGRFMNDANGFCAAHAPGYYWMNADAQGNYFTTWNQLYAANYPGDVGKPCSSIAVTEGYPDNAGGYAAYARGMLGAAAGAQAPGAAAAYAKWKAMTPLMDAEFAKDPNWAIVPR
ncbi:hypothetical protein [Acidovorax sp. SRB_24]|uniref:hypothetical protein n=1 Tax=Acidovorax sp. SRB_24 TaxID=1962700 RepID=UPI00145F9ED1|nr:hypothetical protein [Acidovorax sp. SRB_24]